MKIFNEEQKVEVREIIRTGFPTFIQFLLSPIFAICDTAIVGRLLGTVELAGLSLAWIIVQCAFGIFIFGSYLTNATVSRALGEGDKSKALRCGMDGVYLCLIIGIIVFLTAYFGADFIISHIFNPEPNVQLEAVIYLKVMSFSFPFSLLILATNGILRAFGKTKFLGYIAVITTVLNVVANLSFIAIMHLGIAGSALGSAIVWGLQGIVQLIPVLILVRANKVKKRPEPGRLLDSLFESIPMIIRSVILWCALTFQVSIFSKLGTDAIAANQIVDVVWTFMLTVVESTEVTLQTMLGKKLGSQNFEGAKTTLRTGVRFGLSISSIICVLTCALAFFLPHIFTPDPNVIIYAAIGLIEAGVVLLYVNYPFIMDSALISAKDTKFQAFAIFISAVIFIIAAVLLIDKIPHSPLGYALAWGIYDVFFQIPRLLFAHWRRKTDGWIKHYQSQID